MLLSQEETDDVSKGNSADDLLCKADDGDMTNIVQVSLHILLECYNLKNVHDKCFTCSWLKELFCNVDAIFTILF